MFLKLRLKSLSQREVKIQKEHYSFSVKILQEKIICPVPCTEMTDQRHAPSVSHSFKKLSYPLNKTLMRHTDSLDALEEKKCYYLSQISNHSSLVDGPVAKSLTD
jgi:hypothetical protein